MYSEHHYHRHVAELLQYIFCEDIVCYGIGCFGTCFIARQQFAFLLLIASAMRVRNCQQSSKSELKALFFAGKKCAGVRSTSECPGENCIGGTGLCKYPTQ